MAKKIVFMKEFLESQWGGPVLDREGISPLKVTKGNDVNTEYAKKVVAINNFLIGLLSSDIPEFKDAKSPEHLKEYSECLGEAKSCGTRWNVNINPLLMQLPGDSIDLMDSLYSFFGEAIKTAKYLIDDPSSSSQRDRLGKQINKAKGDADDIVKNITQLIEKIQKYHDDLPAYAAQLTQLANLMTQDKEADSGKIKELEDLIDKADNEIDNLTAEIVGFGIVDAAAITLAIVAVAAAGPLGMVTWIFLGAAVAVATTYIAIDASKIKAIKKDIEAKEAEIGQYNAAITILVEQAKKYQEMSNCFKDIQDNLKDIVAEWEKISGGLGEMQNEIENASKDYDTSDWQSVKKDFENAQEKCEAVKGSIKNLDISSLQAAKAELHIGMSEQEVKTAIEEAGTIPVVDYISKLA